jgi:S-adenosyl-L-methionine hydrolase (adenosine-forming)
MSSRTRIVTLLTDFGLRDHFVAAMKGVMLGINPQLRFVDISHLVPPQDVRSGAFTLSQAYPYFPPRTIHVAVVDPEVGTARKAIIVTAGDQFFVAPDNGLLTYVLEREAGAVVFEITAVDYFRQPVSATFHGRDVFAPVAAWISRDTPIQQMGAVLKHPVRFGIPALERRGNLIQAAVLAADHFGNLVTNLIPDDLPAYGAGGSRSCKIVAGQREITSFRRTFAEGSPGEIFVVPGSAGYLEIVVRNGSAASELSLTPGAIIGVVLE